MSRPRSADPGKYPVPAILDHIVRGDRVFDTWARGFTPPEGDKRAPSSIQKWVGRYSTREEAQEAFDHFKATGERLVGRCKSRVPTGTRSTFVLERPTDHGARYDVRGRTAGTPGAVYIGSFPTRSDADAGAAAWLADPTFRKRRAKREKAPPRPRAPRPPSRPAPRAKPVRTPKPAPAPPVFATPQPAATNPRWRKPGETASDWARRLGLV